MSARRHHTRVARVPPVPPVTPLSLVGSKLKLDLNADITTPGIGSRVASCPDQSSFGNTLANGVMAQQPTLVAAVLDGHAGIQFAGSQWLFLAPTFAGLPIGCWPRIYCVAAYDDAFGVVVGYELISLVQDTTNAYRCRLNTNGSTHTYQTRNPPAADGVGQHFLNAGYGGVFALFDCHEGATTLMTVNNANGTTTTTSPGPLNGALTRLVVGAQYAFSSSSHSKIVRLLIVDNPTAGEHNSIYAYIKSTYPTLGLP